MRYARTEREHQTIAKTDQVLIMNPEYQSHKRVWEMLKPRAFARLDASEPLAWARPQAGVAVSKLLDWCPASLDLAVLAHGQRELTSPLSEW
jgi:hypothetical protein